MFLKYVCVVLCICTHSFSCCIVSILCIHFLNDGHLACLSFPLSQTMMDEYYLMYSYFQAFPISGNGPTIHSVVQIPSWRMIWCLCFLVMTSTVFLISTTKIYSKVHHFSPSSPLTLVQATVVHLAYCDTFFCYPPI